MLGFAFAVVQAASALTFHGDGTFKIVQFADPHFDGNATHDRLTVQIMGAVLDSEKPDFVAYTGDLCNGGPPAPSCDTAGKHASVLHTAFKAVEERGIPWAITFGNWDRHPETFWNGTTLNDFIIHNFKHTLNRRPPPGVLGDTVFDLPILDRGVHAEKRAVLYFIDTHANDGCAAVKGTGCVYPSEVAWYNTTSATYRESNGGTPLPAVVFHHIPFKAHIEGWNHEVAFGRLDEGAAPEGLGISCTIDDNGFFDAAVANGDVRAMTCGHDHDNDFRVVQQGIQIMYGRKSGMGSYGPPDSWGALPDHNGARVLQLQIDPVTMDVNVDTWIRLADGSTLPSPEQEGKHMPGSSLQKRCNSVSFAGKTEILL